MAGVSEAPAQAFAVNRQSTRRLYEQLYQRIREAVLSGALGPGNRLPSTRDLARELGVSRTTVVAAYSVLRAEGYLEGRVGDATRVAAELPETNLRTSELPSRARCPASGEAQVFLSRLGRTWQTMPNAPTPSVTRSVSGRPRAFPLSIPAIDDFPSSPWLRAVRQIASRDLPGLLQIEDDAGYPPLRSAIAAHFAVARGVRCLPEQVVILSSGQAAIDLVVRVLLEPGERAWVEEPGYLGIKGSLAGIGAAAVAVRVDAEGMYVAHGRRLAPDARLAFVTPSNQFPLGVAMSLSRRLELLDWADSAGAVVVEDDYDSEYRHEGRPLPPLQSLDRADRVIYVGTFSKALFPALRIGFLIVPQTLVEPFTAARRFVDAYPALFEQAVLARFISAGDFGRHLRRMRGLYARRAAALVEAAQRYAPRELSVERPRAGLHVVAWLPHGTSEDAVVADAARLGVAARPLSLYHLNESRRAGLVLGFGAVDEREIARGVQRLARAVAAAGRAAPK